MPDPGANKSKGAQGKKKKNKSAKAAASATKQSASDKAQGDSVENAAAKQISETPPVETATTEVSETAPAASSEPQAEVAPPASSEAQAEVSKEEKTELEVSEPAPQEIQPVEKKDEPPPKIGALTAEDVRENFETSEVRTLLVPVKPIHRLIAAIIVIVCASVLGYFQLHPPLQVRAMGTHEIELAEAGTYVLFFRGDLQDPYGWAKNGRFRLSLNIDLETQEPGQEVTKIEPFKDISGADFFSVAQYEVNLPGEYKLWVKWNTDDKCKGYITIEKDPVEKFILKWVMGIIGLISFFFMIGVPMTSRKALTTLPDAQVSK